LITVDIYVILLRVFLFSDD